MTSAGEMSAEEAALLLQKNGLKLTSLRMWEDGLWVVGTSWRGRPERLSCGRTLADSLLAAVNHNPAVRLVK